MSMVLQLISLFYPIYNLYIFTYTIKLIKYLKKKVYAAQENQQKIVFG